MSPSAIKRKDLALPGRERVEGSSGAVLRKQPRDQLPIDDDFTSSNALRCLDDLPGARDAILQEIAPTVLTVLEQTGHVFGLDVLGEDEHADGGMPFPDRIGRLDPLQTV